MPSGGAPVVFEPHPTYDNLFGRIEYNTDQGALYTSYRQLRPGALHRANGGYLIVEADKVAQRAVCLGCPQARPAFAPAKDGVAAGLNWVVWPL